MKTEKICINCKHFPPPGTISSNFSDQAGGPLCGRSMKEICEGFDLVFGDKKRIEYRACEFCRADENDCGPAGRFFERLPVIGPGF